MHAEANGRRAHARRPLSAPERAVILAAVLVVGVLLFEQLATLVLLVVMTLILAIPLTAAADFAERHRIPRAVGAIGALLIGLALLAGLIALLVPTVVAEVNRFVNALPSTVDDLEHRLRVATGSKPGAIGRSVQSWLRRQAAHPLDLLGPVASVGLTIATMIGAVIVMVITAIFIAVRPRPLRTGLLRLVTPPHREHAAVILQRIRAAWLGWLRGLAVAVVLIGLLVYAGLLIVGLPYAIFFATLSALFEVIPYFGGLVSGAPAVLLALTISPGKALAVLAVFLIAHQVDGNLISPLVMARAARLHPAVVAIGVIVVERLFGILGLIIAVPLISTTLILVEEVWVLPRERQEEPHLVSSPASWRALR